MIFGLLPEKSKILNTNFENLKNNFPDNCETQCYVSYIGKSESNYLQPIGYLAKFVHLGSCWNSMDNIIHEIGHRLGFYHMQVNYHRDTYLTISGDQSRYRGDWYNQWNSLPRLANDEHCCADQTNFDFCSNQMYPVTGAPTNIRDSVTQRYLPQWDRDAVQIKAAGFANIRDCITSNFDLYARDLTRVCNTITAVENGYNSGNGLCPNDAHRSVMSGGVIKGRHGKVCNYVSPDTRRAYVFPI